jgi:hypothetical protein
MVLREDGFDVNLAGTGELAMEAFRQKRFDLLVADLRLPDIDGMDVIQTDQGAEAGHRSHRDYGVRHDGNGRGSHETGRRRLSCPNRLPKIRSKRRLPAP